ncbi:hypothetical protein P8452_04958 [Trifolium repens]|nr:hypothetical protein P8452_04958 [Trifolium repens]
MKELITNRCKSKRGHNFVYRAQLMTQRMQQVWTGFYIRSGPMSFPTASSETLTRFQKSIILKLSKNCTRGLFNHCPTRI